MVNLINSNIVIVAQNLNPSIFTQLWLYTQGVFSEKEFKQNSFFTPAAVQVLTDDSELLIVPERLQLTFLKNDKQDVLAKHIIGTIVEALPHTPYNALGFNFNWVSEPSDDIIFAENLREMFLSPKNPLSSYFNVDSARFGMYMAKDIDNMKLKLDMKPVKHLQDSNKEALQLNFNFHKDLRDDIVQAIKSSLEQWLDARKLSEEIVMEVSKRWT
jgi:hypothetical protein